MLCKWDVRPISARPGQLSETSGLTVAVDLSWNNSARSPALSMFISKSVLSNGRPVRARSSELHISVYSVHCYTVHCTLYTVTLYNVHCTLLHCTMYTVRCYTVHCYTVTLYTVQCTLYTVHCYTVQCTLYTVHPIQKAYFHCIVVPNFPCDVGSG